MIQHTQIAVIGGTGKAGKYLVNELISRGYNIKVLLRDFNKLALKSPLIEKMKGDVRNYDDVYSLLNGCSALISTLGQSGGEKPVFRVATANIIRALNSRNINRYIAVTGLTLDTPSDKKSFRTKLLSKVVKLSFPAIIADKQKEYEILLGSNVEWTLVRLPFIKLKESLGSIKINLRDCPGNEISATDLANFLVNQLTDERFIKGTPFISN